MKKQKKSELQKTYKQYLVRSKINKSDNGMHINVLFKKLLIKDEQNFDLFKTWTEEKVHHIVVEYIDQVTKQMKNYSNLSKNWVKLVHDWDIYTKNDNYEESIKKISNEDIYEYIQTNTRENKIRKIEYNFSQGSINNKNNEPEIMNIKKQKIGKIGEGIVRNLLIKKYGIDNVIPASELDPYSPYDFKVTIGSECKYIEVKSSSKLSLFNWFISRREMEFYKINPKEYSIIFVRDININKKSNAIIEEVKNPNITISEKKFGIQGNNLIVTPISYKGLF